jgi:Restriction endonuclease
MNRDEIRSIRAAIESFRTDSDRIDAAVAEKRLLPILRDLLAGDGFELIEQVRPEAGVDYVANRPAGDGPGRRLGVEYKHYGSARRVDVATVERTLAVAGKSRLDRLIIVAKPGFSQDAIAFATRDHPLEIELLDLDALMAGCCALSGWSAVVIPRSSRRSPN